VIAAPSLAQPRQAALLMHFIEIWSVGGGVNGEKGGKQPARRDPPRRDIPSMPQKVGGWHSHAPVCGISINVEVFRFTAGGRTAKVVGGKRVSNGLLMDLLQSASAA
jgi:hypothetical protein